MVACLGISVVTFLLINSSSIACLHGVGTAGKLMLTLLALIWCVKLCISPFVKKQKTLRLTSLRKGQRLLSVFLVTLLASVGWLLYSIFGTDLSALRIILNSIAVFVFELMIFWAGMSRCFIASVQLGIKWRVIALIFAWVVPVNIIVLAKMISLAGDECIVEADKIELDEARAENEICKTRYPVLMVHGVFFRDWRYFNYWGRIPATLIRNGASIYYGNQQSAASCDKSGEELAGRIKQIVEETGCEKVNIIAHSKGGLDSRCAISKFGMDKHVATLTTVNTPHYGCKFADWILSKVSRGFFEAVADKYNRTLKLAGDTNPDFCSAVECLTATGCEKFNEECPDSPDVKYYSIGSVSVKAGSGRFPLNLSYRFVKLFDGENDGLVSLDSMKWGENFEVLRPDGQRGISHGDVIDLNRENIKGFDARELYVKLLSKLKEQGY